MPGVNANKIAEYKFNNTLYDLIPVFNDGFTYTYEDTVNGTITTRTINSDSLPTYIQFGDFDHSPAERVNSLLEVNYLDTSNITDMSSMFDGCENVEYINTSNWDVSNVTSMSGMFCSCNLTSLNVSNWNTINVTNMEGMFYNCHSLATLDVSNWDVSNVTTMERMFYNCESLTTLGDLSDWDVSNVNDIDDIFAYCYKLESLDLSKWDVGNVVDMYEVFYHCHSLKSVGDLSNWNVSNSITTNSLFDNCWELTSVGDLSNWDTKNMIDIGWTFRNCYKLESSAFDSVSNWDVSSVNEMESMFEGCDNLIQLDLSNWDISNVTNMQFMFLDCQNLTELNISNWHLNSEINTTDIFENTNVLSIVAMNNSDYNSVNKVINQLPTRTSDSMGTLNIIGIDDIDQVDTTTVESKFWNIESEIKIKVAEYKFDKSIYENLIPEFNEGFTYTYEDSSIMDGFVTRKLYVAENDFVDISKCISRNKETYNAGIYAGTDIMGSAPMFLDNEILFRGHEWDSLNIDLSDYQGKEINISFTIEHFANQWSELNIGIELYDDTDLDGYSGVTYEDCLSENLIKEYSVTWTIPNEKCRLYLGGMYLELSNINIMIEDYNLFPNHILTEYDYIESLGFKVNKPSLYDNKLAFSHYWNGFNIECEQFKGKEATISFDIEEIANGYGFSKCEIYITQTVEVPLNDHYSNTFIIESDHIYIGGNGIKITNLQILVDNRTTEETISNLPTLMRFGTETTSNSALSLLEVNYLDTSNVTDMGNMFRGCSQLTQLDVNNWDTSNVQYMYGMFYDCSQLIQLDLTNWDISSVRDVNGMFVNCSSLTQLDVSTWDTKSVTDMNNTFYNCPLLTLIDVSTWDTKNVTDISGMFFNCNKLTSIDVSNFDTTNVTNMEYMFDSCNNLTSLDVSNFDTNNVTDMSYMFTNCSNLSYINMNNSDYNSVNKVIEQLPTRTSDSMGTLNIAGINDINQVDTTTAESKFWNIIRNVRNGTTVLSKAYIGDKKISRIYIGDKRIF